MLSIIPILLNIHLLPLPVDTSSAPDSVQIEATQISAEDDLAIFSENFFSKPFSELRLKNHSSPADMAETGLIENGIFFVYDKKGNSLGVLKVMPTGEIDDEILFEEEFHALDSLRNVSFEHFNLIDLYGRAQGEVDGEDSLILAESTAPGKTINQLIKDYAKMTSTGGKNEALQDINSALVETALAMAEFHSKSPKIKANPDYLAKYSGHLPGPYGLIHGDTHPGNIFYDKAANKVTFIDFQMTPELSVGGPTGYDVAYFITTIEMLGQYKHIPESETKNLVDSFLTTYQANGPALTEEDITFYQRKLYNRYASLAEDDLTGPDSHQARFIRDYCALKLTTT